MSGYNIIKEAIIPHAYYMHIMSKKVQKTHYTLEIKNRDVLKRTPFWYTGLTHNMINFLK